MSFILDAIAKSEQERQQQEVPGANTLALPASSVLQPRRILPYILVGVLLLNAVLFVIWMQSGKTFFNWSSPVQVENLTRQNEQTIVPDNANSADQLASVGDTVNAATPEVVANIDSTALMNQSHAEQKSKTPVKTGESAEIYPNGPETVTNDNTTAWKLFEPDNLSNKAFSTELTPEQGVENTSVMHREVSSLSELPDTVRKDLPKVVFSGHLYSSDPNSRVVFVDQGRSVKEGGQIVDELILHEITPTGVVVEFRGYLIEIGVLQNWTLN